MFPDEPDIARVKRSMFDPFEYLALRHKAGLMRTDFARPLGKVAYHVACHLRVQNIGLKTRDILQLIPLDAVGAIVPEHRSMGLDSVRESAAYVASLESDILHSQVAGDVVATFAERPCEIRRISPLCAAAPSIRTDRTCFV